MGAIAATPRAPIVYARSPPRQPRRCAAPEVHQVRNCGRKPSAARPHVVRHRLTCGRQFAWAGRPAQPLRLLSRERLRNHVKTHNKTCRAGGGGGISRAGCAERSPCHFDTSYFECPVSDEKTFHRRRDGALPGRGRGYYNTLVGVAAGPRRGCRRGGGTAEGWRIELDRIRAAVAVLVSARRGRRSPFGGRATGTAGFPSRRGGQ